MKTLTAVAILWLAVNLTGVSSAEEVKDKDGKSWTCRDKDGSIYTMNSGVGIHEYNIQAAALDPNESDLTKHKPICIEPMMDSMKWKWPTAKHIKVSFTPLTTKTKVCNSQPFRTAPGDSNDSDTLESDVALNDHSYCAYKLTFTSSLGKYDPHIIIKGSGLVMEMKELKEEIRHLEITLQEVKKDLERLEKEQEKNSKHHE